MWACSDLCGGVADRLGVPRATHTNLEHTSWDLLISLRSEALLIRSGPSFSMLSSPETAMTGLDAIRNASNDASPTKQRHNKNDSSSEEVNR